MQSTARPAAPMRALLVVLLLTGFGLWQAWQCSDGMMASPIAGMPTMTMTASHGDHLAEPGASGQPLDQPDTPMSLAGLCLSVLASIAAALTLLVSPLRLWAMLRRIGTVMVRPVDVAPSGPLLAQLCISRT